MIIKKCLKCNKEFRIYPSVIKRGGGKYCSNRCSHLGKKYSENHRLNISRVKIEQVPWNKGTVGIMKAWNKGKETGISPWLGKKRPEITGENNYLWKGGGVGYLGLHAWVNRCLGKPTKCEHCGKDGLTGRKIHWANIDHNYKRKLTDWIRLCVGCHIKYDKNINL